MMAKEIDLRPCTFCMEYNSQKCTTWRDEGNIKEITSCKQYIRNLALMKGKKIGDQGQLNATINRRSGYRNNPAN